MAKDKQESNVNVISETVETKGEDSKDDEYPHGARLFLVVVAIFLSAFLPTMDLTIVATAIPKITDEFNGLNVASWYGSAFFLTNGSSQSAWGKAYKYFDLKGTFLVAILIFELGSLVCGVAPNSNALIVGRAIAGLGAAGVSAGGFLIIAFIAPPAKRAMYTSVVGLSFGVAAVLGPLLGGAFTTAVTWRWCFYINLPIGGFAALIVSFFFHTPSRAKPAAASWVEKFLQMDLGGVIMILCALLCFGLAVQKGGQTESWSSSTVIGLLVGFVAILCVFIGWEYLLRDRAMIDLRIFARRTVAVNGVFAAFFTGSYFITIYYLPIYFQSIHGDSAALSGVHNLPLILTSTAAVIGGAALITAYRHAVPVQVISAAIATAGAGLLYTLRLDTGTGRWVGSQILGAVGWGAALQVPIIIAQGTATASDLPSVTAIILCAGTGILLLSAQSAFVNTIAATLHRTAQDINPATVIATGATQLRQNFDAQQLPSVLAAYMNGLEVVFAISIATGGIAFFVAFLNSWEKLGSESM